MPAARVLARESANFGAPPLPFGDDLGRPRGPSGHRRPDDVLQSTAPPRRAWRRAPRTLMRLLAINTYCICNTTLFVYIQGNRSRIESDPQMTVFSGFPVSPAHDRSPRTSARRTAPYDYGVTNRGYGPAQRPRSTATRRESPVSSVVYGGPAASAVWFARETPVDTVTTAAASLTPNPPRPYNPHP